MEEERENSQIWWVGVLLQRSLYPDTVWRCMESYDEVNMPNWVSCKPVFMVWTSFKLALHARKECKLMFRVHWIITSEIFRGLCSVLEVGLIQTTSIDKATIIENSIVSRHHAWSTSVVEFPSLSPQLKWCHHMSPFRLELYPGTWWLIRWLAHFQTKPSCAIFGR